MSLGVFINKTISFTSTHSPSNTPMVCSAVICTISSSKIFSHPSFESFTDDIGILCKIF